MTDDKTIRLAPGVAIHENDLVIRYVASRGPGGQNVNKRATKAELRVRIDRLGLDEEAAERLRSMAGQRATAEGELIITSDQTRSQRRNRDDCIDRLSRMVNKAVQRPRKRRPTRPTAGSERRRLEGKKQRGQIKRLRRDPDQ